MHLVLMVIVLLADGGEVRVQGHGYASAQACEAAKADVSAQATAAGFTQFGLSCVDVQVGAPS